MSDIDVYQLGSNFIYSLTSNYKKNYDTLYSASSNVQNVINKSITDVQIKNTTKYSYIADKDLVNINTYDTIQKHESIFLNIPIRYFDTGIRKLVQVSCGWYHSIFLENTGSVYVCGRNNRGQLGLGDDSNRTSLVKNSNSCNIVQVSAGAEHTLLLNNSGNIFSCGMNTQGQLGIGNNNNTFNLSLVKTSNIVQVSAGAYYSLFLQNQGYVFSCGDNSLGRCGLSPSTDMVNNPTQIVNMTNICEIQTGYNNSLLLQKTGIVFACGANSDGQLGIGTISSAVYEPIQVNVSNIIQVATGARHTLFLNSNGDVYGCGVNNNGELGLGSASSGFVTTPVILGISNIVQISAGTNHTVLLQKTGKIFVCGDDKYGELGLDRTNTCNQFSLTEINISNINNVYANHINTIFLENTGSFLITGNNDYTKTGISSTVTMYDSIMEKRNIPIITKPHYVPYVSIIESFKTSFPLIQSKSKLYVTKNKNAKYQSYNYNDMFGKLNLNNTIYEDISGNILANVIKVEAGETHSVFLLGDNTVYVCGNNFYGQLGTNNFQKCFAAKCIANNIIDISCGAFHTVLLKNDNTVLSCGRNTYGQLGVGDNMHRNNLTQVISATSTSSLSSINIIKCGDNHTMFSTTTGNVLGCGQNSSGQLGINNLEDQNKPVYIVQNTYIEDPKNIIWYQFNEEPNTCNIVNDYNVYGSQYTLINSSNIIGSSFFNNTTNSSMVLWYKFDGNSNQMLLDSSGNNYNATIYSLNKTPLFDNYDYQKGYGSLKLDGKTNQGLKINNFINMFTNGSVGSNHYTFSIWIKISNLNSNTINKLIFYCKIFYTGILNTNYVEFTIRYYNNILYFQLAYNPVGTSNRFKTISITLGDNNWHLWTWVIEDTSTDVNSPTANWYVYKDAIFQNSTNAFAIWPSNIYDTTTNFFVISLEDPTYITESNSALYANLDDFRIYRKILTQSEISELYNYRNIQKLVNNTLSTYAYKNAYIWKSNAYNAYLTYNNSKRDIILSFHNARGFSMHFVLNSPDASINTIQSICFIGNTSTQIVHVYLQNNNLYCNILSLSIQHTIQSNVYYIVDITVNLSNNTTNITLFINGNIVSTTSTSYSNQLLQYAEISDLQFNLGKNAYEISTPLYFILQDFRIYSSILSSQQISLLQTGAVIPNSNSVPQLMQNISKIVCGANYTILALFADTYYLCGSDELLSSENTIMYYKYPKEYKFKKISVALSRKLL